MENIERQLVRINNSINNIYSSINVLTNALLIQQTNSLIDSLRHSRSQNSRPSSARPARPTGLFTTPSPPTPPPRTSTRNLADILGSLGPPPVSQFNPETSRASVSATSAVPAPGPGPTTAPAPAPAPAPPPAPPPPPTTAGVRTDLNRRRRDDTELFNSLFSNLMSNDFANMEVSLFNVAPPLNRGEENIVISHHNIFSNTKVLVKKYDKEVFLDANENSNDDEDEDNDNQVELDKCTICQDYIRENSIVRQINKCKHTFHIECADRWFQDNIKCPHCRQDIRENVN